MSAGDDIDRQAATPSQRLHALDALRATAMFGVVVMHAQLSYMDHPYGPPLWAIYDHPVSRALSIAFWWFHPFRLPLFFFIGGFFAAQLYATRGPAAFLRQRVERILVPFVVGGVVLLPVIFYVFAAGWWLTGLCTWDEIRRVRFNPSMQAELFGPVHLWFLEYLFLYCLALWALRWLRPRDRLTAADPETSWRDRLLASPWRPLWCALPTALVIAIDAGAVTTHRNSFVPSPFQFLHYAIFFAFGVRCYRFRHELGRFVQGSGVYLLLSLPLFWFVEPLVQAQRLGALGPLDRILLPLALALFAWLCLFGFLGLFQSIFTRPNRRLRYLSDAAYWVYLIHVPIVAALQIALAHLPGPGLLKWAVVVTLTTAACLWSYERWARYTVIGAVLHGRRRRPPDRALIVLDGAVAPVSA
jgi:peptidoglycan/LPS O-acetylase OafA/YrhL